MLNDYNAYIILYINISITFNNILLGRSFL